MRFFWILFLTFVLLFSTGAFAQDEEEVSGFLDQEETSISLDEELTEVIKELGQGLVIEEGITEDGRPCLVVVNHNTQKVLWSVVYEDIDGDGTFSSQDEIVSIVNPAGKEIPAGHLVSPLRNRFRNTIQERMRVQEESQIQEEEQYQEEVQDREKARERVQERAQNRKETKEERMQSQNQTQGQGGVQNEAKTNDRPRPNPRPKPRPKKNA